MLISSLNILKIIHTHTHTRIHNRDDTWPKKPKAFTIWFFIGKVC